MKTTLSVIKADIGSIGGHICPSHQLLQAACSPVPIALPARQSWSGNHVPRRGS